MKKYRRLSAFVLALTLCFSLAACGTTELSTGTASSETEITTEITTETSADGTTDAAEKPDDRPGDPPSGDRPDAPPDGNGGPDGTPPGGGGPGGSSANIDYTGAVEITSADTQAGKNYDSSTADESALLISTSDDVTITNPTVTKTGDSDSGTSSFSMTGGTLTSKNGHVFHVTNTNAVINLSGVKIVNEDTENVLLSVCADGWSGASNIATLNADGQELTGIIMGGDDSQLTLNLTTRSTFTGSIDGDNQKAKGTTVSTEVGTVAVKLDSSSTWELTADTYITSFEGDASSVISNGYTLYVNGTALSGTK